jgi:hypothetical protein
VPPQETVGPFFSEIPRQERPLHVEQINDNEAVKDIAERRVDAEAQELRVEFQVLAK